MVNLQQRKFMQKKFLEEIADKLIATYGTNFSKVAVVLPANRAKRFLKKYLHEKIEGPFWAPQLFVFPELVQWLSNHKIGSQLNQLLLFYNAYNKVVAEPEPFELFVKWAPTVINDFNDIDQYLVDSKALFVNLRNIDFVEQWSLKSDNLSPSQQRYISFWDDLGKTYFELEKQRSASQDAFSYASLTRWLCAHPQAIQQKLENMNTWFVGIASLTPAEEEMVKLIDLASPTQLLWDADVYYTDDALNNAGSFFRNYAARNHIKINAADNFSTTPKLVELHQTTTPTGEVLSVAAKLAMLTPDELNNTAVVLADQSLTEPLMSALPALPVPINLALGLPLKGHAISKWISTLLKMKATNKKDSIHYTEFLEWLHLSESLGVSRHELVQIRKEISNRVMVFLRPKDCIRLLQKHSSTAKLMHLFEDAQPMELMEKLRAALYDLLALKNESAILQTAIVKLMECMDEVLSTLHNHAFTNTLVGLEKIWQLVSHGEQVHFQGEPVHGLQVLSLVETRALDFQNILLVGANEDTLPGKAQDQTYIPWDIRYELKMPLPDDREAMYAYSMYRLIQRASGIFIYSSSVSSDFKGTEPSRYILQLKDELPARNASITWKEYKQRFDDAATEKAVESMPNDDFAKQQLDSLFASGISPSAIGKYIKCPLDFYYRYIIGLGEAEQVEENMDAATFGSIIHNVLEEFYLSFLNHYPTLDDILTLESEITNKLQDAITKIYSTHELAGGYNQLAVSIAEDMLLRFLKHEKKELEQYAQQNLQPKVEGVEVGLTREVDMAKYGLSKPIKMRGMVDRLDSIAGRLRIVDYKTGKVDNDAFEIKESDDVKAYFSNWKKEKIIQLLSYIYMKGADGANPENIDAAFYSFINHSRGYTYLNTYGRNRAELMEEFEKGLVQWTQAVYNSDSFEHDPDSKYCQYCPKTGPN